MEFAAGSLYTYFGVSYDEKFKADGIVAPDIETPVLNKLTKEYTSNHEAFMKQVEVDRLKFRPLGDKVHEYTRVDRETSEEQVFEIYRVSLYFSELKGFHS